MPDLIKFTTREPIGSSTYPMPNCDINEHRSELQSRLQRVPSLKEEMTSIYIHIPFCDKICSFCGFNKYISTEEKKVAYVDSLIKEMEYFAKQPYVQDLKIGSAYIGGGTPNTLSANLLDKVLGTMRNLFNFSVDTQLTLEGTPQNFTDERIETLIQHKIDRVSAGVQTFSCKIRQEHLNMRYSEEQLLGFLEKIAANFDDFNIDMIYNLPGQTDDIWRRDLEMALSIGSTHLTIYPLVLLENTAFYSTYIKQQKVTIPSQEKELAQFDLTLELMQKSRFVPHTIRDWALNGKVCRYIDLNAKCNQVLAFGAGSHGYLAGATYRNERNIAKYIQAVSKHGIPMDQCRIATTEELMQRFMVMGLRLYVLNMRDFTDRFELDWRQIFGKKIDAMVRSGFLNIDGDIITHTKEGHIWANNIRTYFEGDNKGASVGYTDSLGVDKSGKGHYQSISRIKAAADVEAHT